MFYIPIVESNFVVYVKKLEVCQASISHIVDGMVDGLFSMADNSSIILLNRIHVPKYLIEVA